MVCYQSPDLHLLFLGLTSCAEERACERSAAACGGELVRLVILTCTHVGEHHLAIASEEVGFSPLHRSAISSLLSP